jgi:hypothetical protein
MITFMNDGALCENGRIVFSHDDDKVFWREIACMTRKDPNSRPSSEVLARVRGISGLPIYQDSAHQTDPVVIICPPKKMLQDGDEAEIWTRSNLRELQRQHRNVLMSSNPLGCRTFQ